MTGDRFSNARASGQFVFDLPDGKIVVAGILRDRPNQTFAVIGGTGAYEGARGTQTEKDLGVGGVETFHRLP